VFRVILVRLEKQGLAEKLVVLVRLEHLEKQVLQDKQLTRGQPVPLEHLEKRG